MIARLTGTPTITTTSFIIDVNGVGYDVQTTLATQSWASSQSMVTLLIHTHVTETSLELFGFQTETEKHIFMLLTSVSGVGPKTALGILNLGVEETVHSIQQANISFFSRAPRVGKKLAQKIIIELSSKLGGLQELDLAPLNTQEQEIIAAVQALGFDEQAARNALRTLEANEHTSTQEYIKQLIKLLASN